MHLKPYDLVWTFENANEHGVELKLEISDHHRGEVVRLRHVSQDGKLRRTLATWEIAGAKSTVNPGGTAYANSDALELGRAVCAHLESTGWSFHSFVVGQASSLNFAPNAVFEAPLWLPNFLRVAESLPADLVALEARLPRAMTAQRAA